MKSLAPPPPPLAEALIRFDAVDPRFSVLDEDIGGRDRVGAALVVGGLNRLVVPRFAPRLVVSVETGPAAWFELATVDGVVLAVEEGEELPVDDEDVVELAFDAEELGVDEVEVEELDAVLLLPADGALVDPEERGMVTAVFAFPERCVSPRPPRSCGAKSAAYRSAAMTPDKRTVRSTSPNCAVTVGTTVASPCGCLRLRTLLPR
jgi:hypothetical protein